MAAPDILNPTSVKLKTFNVALSTTSATSLLSNAASSGLALKVISCRAANVDGTANCDITLKRHSAAAGGGTGYALASTVTVPADAALDLITEDAPVGLEEDSSLFATASAGGDIEITGTYLEIS